MESALLDRAAAGGLGVAKDALAPDKPRSGAAASDFGELVNRLVAEVNEKQNAAAKSAEGVASGETDIMDAVLTLNEADLSLRMMMQIRDRAIDAYQRIMRSI